MRRYNVILIGILLLNFTTVFAQIDTIYPKKNILGTLYFQNKQFLTRRDFHEIIKFNPNAEAEYKASKLNNAYATLFAIASGICLGWTLGEVGGGADLDVGLLALGVGFYGVSIPFSMRQRKYKMNAMKIYNESVRQKGKNN